VPSSDPHLLLAHAGEFHRYVVPISFAPLLMIVFGALFLMTRGNRPKEGDQGSPPPNETEQP
jgi:hypothetical protein